MLKTIIDENREYALESLAVTMTRGFFNHGFKIYKFMIRPSAKSMSFGKIELMGNLLKAAQNAKV